VNNRHATPYSIPINFSTPNRCNNTTITSVGDTQRTTNSQNSNTERFPFNSSRLWDSFIFQPANTANIMLPLGGFFIAVFAVWVMKRDDSVQELDMGDGAAYMLWYGLVRYVTPFAVLVVFLNVTGLVDFSGLLGLAE